MQANPEQFHDNEAEPQPRNSRGFTQDQWEDQKEYFLDHNYTPERAEAATIDKMGERPPSLEEMSPLYSQGEINFRAIRAIHADGLARQLAPIESDPIMSAEEKTKKTNATIARYLAHREISDRPDGPVRR